MRQLVVVEFPIARTTSFTTLALMGATFDLLDRAGTREVTVILTPRGICVVFFGSDHLSLHSVFMRRRGVAHESFRCTGGKVRAPRERLQGY